MPLHVDFSNPFGSPYNARARHIANYHNATILSPVFLNNMLIDSYNDIWASYSYSLKNENGKFIGGPSLGLRGLMLNVALE